jgi:hypothetical protein
MGSAPLRCAWRAEIALENGSGLAELLASFGIAQVGVIACTEGPVDLDQDQGREQHTSTHACEDADRGI